MIDYGTTELNEKRAFHHFHYERRSVKLIVAWLKFHLIFSLEMSYLIPFENSLNVSTRIHPTMIRRKFKSPIYLHAKYITKHSCLQQLAGEISTRAEAAYEELA